MQDSIRRAGAGGSGIEFGRGYGLLIVGEVAAALWLFAIGSTMAPAALTEPGGARRSRGALPARIPPASPGRRDARDAERCSGPTGGGRAGRAGPARAGSSALGRAGLGPVAVASALPGTSHAARYVEVEGLPRADDAPAPAHLVRVARVDVGYLEALGQPVVHGRSFDMGDLGEDRSAAIVKPGLRRSGARGPLSPRPALPLLGPRPGAGPWSFRIVGVVGPLGMNALAPDADEGIYHVAGPGELHPVAFAMRVGSDPEAFIPRLRTIVSEIEPNALIQNAGALDQVPDPDRRVMTMATYLRGRCRRLTGVQR